MNRGALAALFVSIFMLGAGEGLCAENGFDPNRFGFGAALAVSMDGGDRDRIDEASLINGIIRVSKESNVEARLMLETHYLWEAQNVRFLGVSDPRSWAWGPFVAMQPGEADLIDSIGAGVLASFRRCISPGATASASNGDAYDCGDGDEEKRRAAFNIGLGVIVDPNAKVLGDGLQPNHPLPEGETEIRFKETDQWGLLVLVSFSI